ncbi:MAG: hypothetical protein Q8930_18140 [Bacillota bacterium]|nr:hypothetical protein [Bacillota bacterium]
MQRKKQLYEKMIQLEHELKDLTTIVKYEDSTATEDEIHGWVIRMNSLVTRLEHLKEEVLEFYTS